MKKLTRREFLAGGTAAAAAAGACACGAGGCSTISGVGATPAINPDAYTVEGSTVTVALDKVPQLAVVGGSVKIIDERLPDRLIVAMVEDGRRVVASIRCTHRGVEVDYRSEDKCFKCASLGGSKFGLDGKNMGGPAKKPLKIYKATMSGESMTVQIA